MTTYLSSLLTSTTSRYNNLRRTLLSDEADGDSEEDSHISRVLRAYYVEKGQAFPPWLGPGPSTSRTASSLYSQATNRQPAQPTAARRPGGLSDLWDSPSSREGQTQQPTSLRRSGQAAAAARTLAPAPTGAPLTHYKTADSYSSSSSSTRPTRPPLFENRTTAPYQWDSGNAATASSSARSSGAGSIDPGTTTGTGTTTQDKLKAKLWGAGRNTTSRGPI